MHISRLTGRGLWRLHFRSWCYWLDWSGLFGGEFLQADASLLEHLLDRALLLENFIYLVLMEDRDEHNSRKHYKASHIKEYITLSEKQILKSVKSTFYWPWAEYWALPHTGSRWRCGQWRCAVVQCQDIAPVLAELPQLHPETDSGPLAG